MLKILYTTVILCMAATVHGAIVELNVGESITVNPSATTTVVCKGSSNAVRCDEIHQESSDLYDRCVKVYGPTTQCLQNSILKNKPSFYCKKWTDLCFDKCEEIIGPSSQCLTRCS